MTKKLLCLIATLLLLLTPLLATAETAAAIYEDVDGRFTFSYPESWILLDKETIDVLLAAAGGVDDANFQQQLESMKPQIEQLGMIMLMSEDLGTNINLILQEVGVELTGVLLEAMAPSISQQLSAALSGLTITSEPALIEVGDAQVLAAEYAYSVSGVDMAGMQVYLPAGTNLVILSMTASNGQESFEAGKQVLLELAGSFTLN